MVHFKLSDLSEKLLGVKLDKSEQCSNWAIRPLRANQKRYAAMDAYIVVELFSKLKASADSSKVQRDCKKEGKNKVKKERMKIDDMSWSEILRELGRCVDGTRQATELQCIVDSMLFGLGKHMRRCGVNVLIPENRHELKCRASGSERIILTSGKAFDELKQLFPSRVLCIPNVCSLNPIEQLKYVFTRYKVSLVNFWTCSFSWDGPKGSVPSIHGSTLVSVVVILCIYDMVVECHGGTVDIIANIVTHDHLEEGVDVIVR
ncbi:hypothetical protein OSTOST_24740, partial [Ostertagia ostertagi]